MKYYFIMFASLLSLGAKYVPRVLKTIGSGLGKLIGGSNAVRRIGHKLQNNVIGKQVLGLGKHLVNALTQPADTEQRNDGPPAIEDDQIREIDEQPVDSDNDPVVETIERKPITHKISKRKPKYLKKRNKR